MMKYIIRALLALVFISCNQPANQKEESVTKVNYLLSPQEFEQKMKEDVVVIDVRTPGEIAQGVISSPQVINFQDPDFAKMLEQLDRNKTYLVYCRAGGRSGRTRAMLNELGFEKVYDLDGGITAWENAGLPVSR